MGHGVSTRWFCAVAAFLAGASGISCGAGIQDGRGEVYATRIVGQSGGQIVLREATLDVKQDCVQDPVPITLRRYESIKHSGAVGPVFEIEVPTPDTFRKDPQIDVATSSLAVTSLNPVIGFLVPGADNEQWVPDSPMPAPSCPSSVVCGPVQSQTFTDPGSDASPVVTTRVLLLAIVTQCATIADCPSNQTCNSKACQECPKDAPCNP
jgi:hypothetical protein